MLLSFVPASSLLAVIFGSMFHFRVIFKIIWWGPQPMCLVYLFKFIVPNAHLNLDAWGRDVDATCTPSHDKIDITWTLSYSESGTYYQSVRAGSLYRDTNLLKTTKKIAEYSEYSKQSQQQCLRLTPWALFLQYWKCSLALWERRACRIPECRTAGPGS